MVFSASRISIFDKSWFSQWHITVMSFSFAFIMPFNITSLFITSFPSSDMIFTSPLFIGSKWLKSSPVKSLVIDKTWFTSTSPTSLALSLTRFAISTVLHTGLVFAIKFTITYPPFTAAFEPLSISSLYVYPGSLKCTCKSTNPGITTSPFASIVLQSLFKLLPISDIIPSLM